MGDLRVIAISDIKENPVALRTVNKDSEEYQGLVDSIRQKGFLGAITVRPQTDENDNEYFELVDGLHRFSAAQDAGLDEINVDVVSLDDDSVLEAQIMANIHKIETRAVEYSQQLKRILTRNPLMTEAELAHKLGKSSAWISGRLGLNKITNETIQALINDGKIGLSNAYALAKLPPEEQADWTDRAMTLPPDEFVPAVTGRVKEIREARRKGQDAAAAEFQPVAFMQKILAVKEEMASNTVGDLLINELNVTDPRQAWSLAVKWCLHLDPRSVEEQKAKDAARKKEREEKKKAKAAERAAKKAEKKQQELEDAAKAAEEAQAALQA